jgi:trk system potassium uptake protein TrkH
MMILRTLAIILGVAALIMTPALVFALILGETVMARAFIIPMGITLGAALPAVFLIRPGPFRLSPKDGFLLVFLTWAFTSLLGAIPYYLSERGISFTDAFFESACGFATTGVTTLPDIESLPRSLLLWRSMSHWFGGMGIVLLTVALMPLLGVGGFQLIKAETPGPEKEKISPKITATAKLLWLTYCVLSAVLFLLFRLGGMDWFDALCHALTTIASGGASTKNTGIGYYNSPFIEVTATIFMLLGGVNFNLYYRLLKGKFKDIFYHTESRAYFFIFITVTLLITWSLTPVYGSPGTALRYASYQTASVLSTTGSALTNYETWPVFAKTLLLILMLIGGCSGSTAGGVKVIRHVVLAKQAGNELRRIVYPKGIFSVRLNRKVGRKDVIYGVAGFIFLYFMVVAATTLITAASGGSTGDTKIDLFSSFSAALSVTGNVGIGFGAVGPAHNYGIFPAHIKWLFSFVMIAGRLELWTVFILFTPEYWRR